MGILNLTPDSFSDGGRFQQCDDAVAHARSMMAQGAALVDVGAESTRPGHKPIPAGEEWSRMADVLSLLAREGIPFSVDTTKAAVARQALVAGACMVNDVSGLQDVRLASLAAEHGAWLVLTHTGPGALGGTSFWEDGLLDSALEKALQAGMKMGRIMVDPGIGFGKDQSQNIKALASLDGLVARLGLPLLLGVSRKSVLGHITGQGVEGRVAASISAALAAVSRCGAGCAMVRVHDVAPHRDALAVWGALSNAQGGRSP
ncbi:dihydropteroate synthase [Formicincola oecophyllae]|uniref:dihydropteroate synthase n=1 Tax=Formicincola oecophyllae TaxID=2558361 RepID=A0A4Y6U7T5_9PROT|nr:dihydropteroate synthase [Formicincola oecophyllae]QDH13402.1 dihydropteroate synthase [Formicincola oecophyllae]